MASFNKVILCGNVTRDPELKYTPGGTAVVELGLAINRHWTDRNSSEKKEETTFVDVTLWGRTAEVAAEYLMKGRPALIEGRLQLDQWEDQASGQKRQKLKVVGESLQLLGTAGGSGGGGNSNGSSSGGNGSNSGGNGGGGGNSAPAAGDPAMSEYFGGVPAAGDEEVPF